MHGSYVALVTPFKNGEIDYNALEKLIDFHLENHTDGILFCGTTGESPALAGDEKESLIRFGCQRIQNKVPIMVGTGSNNVANTIASTMKAKNLGADSALVITPYYNKPTQEGMYQHFKKVATSCDIPIVIYNVPGRTGVSISAETTLRLAHDFKNIVAIKEASGDLVQISKIIKDAPANFSVLSGEDALNYPIMCLGGKGAISVTANILPFQLHELVRLSLLKEYDKALKIHLDLLDANKLLFIETNPMPVKFSLWKMGFIENEIRLPLVPLQNKFHEMLEEMLHNYQLV
jgi:4-hydroxy-tetrahydrodipicolinate synthase